MTKARHHSASPYEKRYGFCRALRSGSQIWIAGTAPIGPDGQRVSGSAGDQARRCFEVIVEAVEALGGGAGDIVRTRMYLVDAADAESVGEVHASFFGAEPPVATMLLAGGLLDSEWKIEVEAEAVIDRD